MSRLSTQFAKLRRLKAIRSQFKTLVLLIAVAVFGIGIGSFLVVHERFEWPSWMPFVGQSYYDLNAKVSAVSGVLPGQGQAVTISGVTVGQISGLKMKDGVPVVTMKIDPQYASRIYSNASLLLRPKTGLEDMVAQLNPGTPKGGHRLASGSTLSTTNSLSSIDLDQVWAQLDADTRDELMELVSNAGEAVSGKGGEELANTLRDFNPLSRNTEIASHLVAKRSAELTTLMGNLSRIAKVLGDNEGQITEFVRGNKGVWQSFAQQDAQLQETLKLLPGALKSTNVALTDATELGHTMRSTFTRLQPTAASLKTTLTDLRPFFKQTTPALRTEIRPFTLKALPTAKLLAPATAGLSKSTPGLTTLARELNNIMNELAYKPKHGEGYLFYLPWDSHDTDSLLSNQDGIGPLQQDLLLFNCGTLNLLNTYAASPAENPTMMTIASLLNLPDASKDCTAANTPKASK